MAVMFQRPLDLGADICMTSMTKFIGGHSDLTGGILSVKGKDLADRVYFTQVLPSCPRKRIRSVHAEPCCVRLVIQRCLIVRHGAFMGPLRFRLQRPQALLQTNTGSGSPLTPMRKSMAVSFSASIQNRT